ncbi:hypothetical protein Tco_0066927 [Tanacetum coccineum]
MCHIIGIEPQFKNIIKNGPFIPRIAGQRKPGGQWMGDERKAANLDRRLKSLIMSVLLDDQMNYVINYLAAKSTWDDLILYHEGPSDVKENRVMDLKLCYNTFKFKEGETITQTFPRYKALMNELVNYGIKHSKLKINTGFINGLPKNWLSFCQSLKNRYHVKESEHASLFGKLKYEENLIDNSLDDEEDTRSSQEYMDDLEEEYQSPFQNNSQPILLSSSQHKPEVRPTKDFEAKYNKVKAKLALLISSSSAPKPSMVKNKGLVAEVYKWDEEELSSDDNEIDEVKALMAFTDDNNALTKKVPGMKRILGADQLTEDSSSSRQKYLVFVKTLADNTNVSEAEGFILPNHDTGRNLQAKSQGNIIDLKLKDLFCQIMILVENLPAMSQGNTIDHLVVVTDSSATDYDSGDESSVYRIPLPPLEKLARAEPVSRPKTIKSIFK